jgi:hypothetical protein
VKVKDLITELQKLDPEEELLIPDAGVESILCHEIEVIDYWEIPTAKYALVGK